jgi:hypothetical protein
MSSLLSVKKYAGVALTNAANMNTNTVNDVRKNA